MKLKIILMLLIVLALAAVASAQTKISGTVLCVKPDTEYTIQVGDSPNHSFNIDQGKCNWTKPLDIAGAQTKEAVITGFREVSGNRMNSHYYDVVTMTTGDKWYGRSQGTAILKDGVPESIEGTWTFVGGTGKLKGIKGKGTLKGKVAPEGITYEVEGEYELPK